MCAPPTADLASHVRAPCGTITHEYGSVTEVGSSTILGSLAGLLGYKSLTRRTPTLRLTGGPCRAPAAQDHTTHTKNNHVPEATLICTCIVGTRTCIGECSCSR